MDSDQAKLFVGGISRETSELTLRGHFGKYGDVLGSVVARERGTKNPRGFGFVWFSDPSSADKALRDTHVILGRTVEVKKAIPRSEQHQNQQKLQQSLTELQNRQSSKNSDNGNNDPQFRTKKIFVGGLSSSLTEEQFKNYFEKFGRIIDVVVMHDNMTNRPRGFGFVTFDLEESVENVMQKTFHELNGRLVEVKRAMPKEEINGGTGSYNTRFGGRNGSPYNNSLPIDYPPPSPGYGVPLHYASLPVYSGVGLYTSGAGVFGSCYPMSAYGKFDFGVTPIALRNPWYGPMMIRAGPYPLPYGNTSISPVYMNSGVGLMGSNGGPSGEQDQGLDGGPVVISR